MIGVEELAYEALIKEVELTPKPGLVDKNNNGSHVDMNLETFYKSSNALKPFFSKFFNCGKKALHVEPKILFDRLRAIGLECEAEMFKATTNVNTHKGLIFSFAVICGAMGKLEAKYGYIKREDLQSEIKNICFDLIKKDLLENANTKTNGEKLYKETECAGIRDEAQNGYPTVFDKSLPYYLKQKKIYGEEEALKLTLLFIMSVAIDSNIYARGGVLGMEFVKSKSKALLSEIDMERLDEKLLELDEEMIQRNLSPGGSADLLSLTWFLSKVDL